ncbi:hypothetical protein HD806DRAFT_525859 [Xylariaceae sp. AK1471]|nr:hypothetical protein HD806DRAFT_525859 [Xylariaceae sp. AK1471]
MFQTLKARRNNSGDCAYVVQSSGMPFERNKDKKQRACALCKLKKLKCVAEGDSCIKCLKQGLECSYRATTKPDVTSASRSSKEVSKSGNEVLPLTAKHGEIAEEPSTDSDQSITVREAAASSTNSTPSIGGNGESSFSEGFPFTDLLDSEISFDFWSLSHDSSMDIDDTPIYLAVNDGGEDNCEVMSFPRIQASKSNQEFLLGYSRGGENDPGKERPVAPGESLHTTPQTSSTPITESINWDFNLIQEPPASSIDESSKITSQVGISSTEISRTEPQQTNSPQLLPTTCRCLEQLMGANEVMQVKLVWGACPTNGLAVSVDDMLQCQKDILVSCETLLECKRCSLRSDYVMLIVSMCHEMMNGIGDLSAMLLPGSQNGSSKRSRSESDGGRKRGLKPGGWRLDDADEIQVIKSLIGIRIARLSSLTSQLEKVVKANHPAYEWVIRALRQSITERIGDVELSSF